MSDLQILTQLLNGYHLEPNEIEKAKKLLSLLDRNLKSLIN